MKDLDADSVDLIFCDLPYNQTSCKWDQAVLDLEQFWKQVMRIKKLNTPIFFTTTTKFGVSLIQSAPKKCFFRYDLVWVKSAPAGFLSAKKMPMRKHEMIYVFYEKLPFYDLSSHTHKFLNQRPATKKGDHIYGDSQVSNKNTYEPQLPVSVVKQEKTQISTSHDKDLYGSTNGGTIGNVHGTNYVPPLPVSVVKQLEEYEGDELCKYDVNKNTYGGGKDGRIKVPKDKKYHEAKYDPPLPTTMLEIKSTRGKHSTEKPVALMEWVFKYYSKEGDVVLDPTMGSGSTGVACKNMNRNFIGIEMDEEIFKVAQSRLS